MRLLQSLVFLSMLFSMQLFAESHYDAIIDANYTGTAGKRINGIPVFRKIGEALLTVPEKNKEPFVIYIRKGRYNEKLSVDRPYVHFLGESGTNTVISYGDNGDSRDADGNRVGTWGSYTLRITAPDFYAANLVIENSFNYPANAALRDDDPKKVHNGQAVALMVTDGSDRVFFRDITVIGYQDSLFLDAGRSYFRHCKVLGHVDFIFGAGQAVFDECDVVSRNRANKNPTGYVTAPSTSITYPYGFLFINSRFVKETEDIAKGSVRLGRPWHPGADLKANGSTVFMNCYMDDHIGSEGYARISAVSDTGERVWFKLEPHSRFFEYGSRGPGALSSPNRPTLNDKEAVWYTSENVLNGWKPNLR